MNLSHVIIAIIDRYDLHLDGIHGVAHWARVLENGRKLSEKTGANLKVVSLFAVLHDSQRLNDGHDPDHGPRAAEFAKQLNGTVFELNESELNILYRACHGHTHERTHPDVTIQTCWDSDRLDLGRVGIMPDPNRLCTGFAKRPETIEWANQQAIGEIIPPFVSDEWCIELHSF